MDAKAICEAVVAWAVATCPDLNSVYDADTSEIGHALPVAFAILGEEGVNNNAGGLDQAALYSAEVSIEFLVKDNDEATDRLQGFVAALGTAIAEEYWATGDVTLGGRVGGASPDWRASYEPAYAIFEDGTKHRWAGFRLTVADLV